jgi:hypothetical protein
VAAGFTLTQPNQEFEVLSADTDLLKRLAERTGGRYHQLTALSSLLEQLRRRQTAGSQYHEAALLDATLLSWPADVTVTHVLFALFLALVTAEWLIRRRYLLQ